MEEGAGWQEVMSVSDLKMLFLLVKTRKLVTSG